MQTATRTPEQIDQTQQAAYKATFAKQTIQCACLGTVFKLPMSVVTIIENLGMAAMAGWMLMM